MFWQRDGCSEMMDDWDWDPNCSIWSEIAQSGSPCRIIKKIHKCEKTAACSAGCAGETQEQGCCSATILGLLVSSKGPSPALSRLALMTRQGMFCSILLELKPLPNLVIWSSLWSMHFLSMHFFEFQKLWWHWYWASDNMLQHNQLDQHHLLGHSINYTGTRKSDCWMQEVQDLKYLQKCYVIAACSLVDAVAAIQLLLGLSVCVSLSHVCQRSWEKHADLNLRTCDPREKRIAGVRYLVHAICCTAPEKVG